MNSLFHVNYLVDVVLLAAVVELVVEIVEHVDDIYRLDGGGDVRESYDVAEQDRHRGELLCQNAERKHQFQAKYHLVERRRQFLDWR